MKKPSSFVDRHWSKISLIIIVLFILSRAHIWVNQPLEFTEITYSYMPYAHLWASGTRPYLDQWYEYPPATIPLFYIPHLVDRGTLDSALHINYSEAYRGQLLLLDTLLFVLIWKTLQKQRLKKSVIVTGLLYYIAATAKANHFIYDTMDITFAAAMTLAVASPILFTSFAGKLNMWLGYALALALKLLNGPLGLIYATLDRKKWKMSAAMGTVAFLLVWGLPLYLYRSSLQVMLVYHHIRGLQADSAGAIIVRTINSFTHSEEVIEIYKNYEMTGPATDIALQIISPLFLLTLIGFILYGTWLAWHAAAKHYNYLRVSLTLGYILMLMISMKVLSSPFMLWHIPLLAIYPFPNLRMQLQVVGASLVIVGVTLSPAPILMVGPFSAALVAGIIRTTLFIGLFIWWWREHRRVIYG